MANTYTLTEDQPPTHKWVFDGDGNGATVDWAGGVLSYGVATGPTMGGGTLTFQWSPDGGTTWMDAASIDGSASQHHVLPPGKMRPVLAGATAPSLTVFAR